jgi:nucleotide-binding universal stress UspA family protein
MTIVCGTDFSENAAQAAVAAGAIARRLGEPLALVHIIDGLGVDLTVGGPHDAIFEPLRAELGKKAEELRASMGIEVEPIALPGFVDEQLITVARTLHARLLVVSSLGAQKQHRWLLGSVAERVAQSSPIPLLVVRDGSILEAWARGDRALRVMVGVEPSSTSKAALRWAAELRGIGRCDLFVTEIAWPLGEHLRLGIPGPMPLDQLRPELHEILSRDLRAWADELPGEGATTFTVIPGWGRVESHLTSLAAEARADLLVVGTQRRAGIARLWQGSVSRGVLHHASTNVACVPRGEPTEDALVIPTFRHVLVPTDFSPLANRAIPVAYGLVAPGGIIHLLYVITREPDEDTPEPKERLRALIPQGAAARGITTELEIVADESACMGIWHAAGHLGVDAICMATHGRSGVSSLVLGSQAREVVQRARQPVLLVPPERCGADR